MIVAGTAASQESPVKTGVAASELRTGSDIDSPAEFRLDAVRLRASRLTDDDSAHSDETTDADSEDADPAPAAPRPKIDLFDGPAPRAGAVRRQNVPAPAIGRVPSPAAVPIEDGTSPAAEADRDRPGETLSQSSATPAPLRAASQPTLPPVPVRTGRIGAIDSRLNLRDAPLRGRLPSSDADPFAPTGIRLGTFVLLSAIDQSVGVSDNLDEVPKGAGGAFSETVLSTRLLSDWSRHAAELNAIASYRRNFAGEETSDPDLKLDGLLRLDVDRLTTATLRGAFTYRREDAADLDPLAGSGERPDLLDYSTSAEIERQFGDAFARATLSAVRETTDRKEASALGEDFTTYGGALRAGYRISPAFAPFAEASLGRRIFDTREDTFGIARDSTLGGVRGGVALDLTEKLNGELAAGYAWNVPDAGELATLGSPTLDARIAWSPRRGTDVALTASTTFDPDVADAGTATLYQVALAARHRATARLDLDATVTGGYRDSDIAADVERTIGVGTGFTYWINRSLALIGLASHDRVDRVNGPGDYEVNTVKLGVRVQN